jgi:subtilisin family serine protease
MPDNIPIIINETGTGIQQEGLVEVIVKYHGDIISVGAQAGADIEILTSNYAIATLDVRRLNEFYKYNEVEYIEAPKNLTYFIHNSLRAACISAVQSGTSYNLTGKGVVIGVIDSGIDYTHTDFRNADGTSRVLYIWDQTIQGSPPSGFKNGTEYGSNQLNAALNDPQPLSVVPSTDTIGHGSAVAGVAAGNGRSTSGGFLKGVATEASIIAVKLGHSGVENFIRSTEVMRAIKYIIDKAEALNMPVSINISYGTNNGSHDGTSLFETFIDTMADRWKTVINVATGNEGSAGHHFSARIKQRESATAEIALASNTKSIYLTLWKNFTDTFSFELISPSGKSSSAVSPTESLTSFTLDNVMVTIFSRQPTHYNEAQEIYFMFRALTDTIPMGIWNLVVKGDLVVDGRFDVWLPTLEEVTENTSFFNPSLDITLTIPSTARKVISVGGYNAAIESSADFSGRGYTRSNVFVKPDLVAPAVGITTVKAGGGYEAFTGTSIAVPFVTGSAALMMQWGIVNGNDAFLYGQRIKAFLKKGARRKFTLEYPNTIWGYGTLCLNASVELLNEYKRGGITI